MVSQILFLTGKIWQIRLAQDDHPAESEGDLCALARRRLPTLLTRILAFDKITNLSAKAAAEANYSAAGTSVTTVITFHDHIVSTGGQPGKKPARETLSIVLLPPLVPGSHRPTKEEQASWACAVLQRVIKDEMRVGGRAAEGDPALCGTEVLVRDADSAERANQVMLRLFSKQSARPEAAPVPGGKDSQALLQRAGAPPALPRYGAGGGAGQQGAARSQEKAGSAQDTPPPPPPAPPQNAPPPPPPAPPRNSPPQIPPSTPVAPGKQHPSSALPVKTPVRRHGTTSSVAKRVHPRNKFSPTFALGPGAGAAGGAPQSDPPSDSAQPGPSSLVPSSTPASDASSGVGGEGYGPVGKKMPWVWNFAEKVEVQRYGVWVDAIISRRDVRRGYGITYETPSQRGCPLSPRCAPAPCSPNSEP